jgi:hypothetical protein
MPLRGGRTVRRIVARGAVMVGGVAMVVVGGLGGAPVGHASPSAGAGLRWGACAEPAEPGAAWASLSGPPHRAPPAGPRFAPAVAPPSAT